MEAERWGKRIRGFRKLKGYTQKELAEAIDVSVSVLGEIERGNRLPTVSIVYKISKTLNVSADDLKPTNNN